MPLACQVLPYNPDILILLHNGIVCAKKKGIFKKNKHMWLPILLPPAHKILTKKKYFKVDQKLRNETWPHTFCAGKKKIYWRPESLGNINQIK